jgi:hypothetical protein
LNLRHYQIPYKKSFPKSLLDLLARLRTFQYFLYSGVIRYREDEFIISHKCDFIFDTNLKKIYDNAINDGLAISPTTKWRAHMMCWAASNCNKLEGDLLSAELTRYSTPKYFLALLILKTQKNILFTRYL